MTHCVAILPMKGHSVRVPKKNIRDLAGKPLLYWILSTLQQVSAVNEIVIDTDCDDIEATVKKHFPGIHVLQRPEHLKGDDTPVNLLIENIMAHFPADLYLQTHSTNPHLQADTIADAITAFQNNDNADSLFGVTAWKTRLFWPDGSAVNHNPNELIPTQNLDPVYEENSNLYLFTKDSFQKRDHRIGASPMMFPIDRMEAVDIDDMADFEYADYLMRRKNGLLNAA